MFCIASFVVLFVCGIFSAAYRELARKAWHCVLRRVTFRPCDINFAEEMKGKLLGKIILFHPRLARFLDRWIDWFAWLFAILSVWSLAAVSLAGLNLLIYDTCDPQRSENCSLSGEACSISTYTPGFIDLAKQGHPLQWFITEADTLSTTVGLIPQRFKTWKPEDYIPAGKTTWRPFDPQKPWALEVVDPGCSACASLFANIKAAGFENRYNLTYLAFPIPDPASPSGYKFMHSYLLATYLEALKQVQPARATGSVPPDWRLLEKLYTGVDSEGVKWQQRFNLKFDADEARRALDAFCAEFGYSEQQRAQIAILAQSKEIAAILHAHKIVVEKQLRTVKIPTILFGGRRYDRVVTPARLK
ncbi:MAG TPA: hypothetical protein VG273_26800 [Bryobacteraceae bacterium]|jgi:hypothetical protein|nr:hypothetical protein [Bryobacteraceae bacterium]